MSEPESTPARIARLFVGFLWAIALTLLLTIAIVGATADFPGALGESMTGGRLGLGVLLVPGIILVALLALLFVANRRWRVGWRVLAVAWVVVLPVYFWLAQDEPALRQPLAVEALAPSPQGIEPSYAVLMRYSKQHPSDEAKAFSRFRPETQWTAVRPNEPEKWTRFLVDNRAALVADWETLRPQRMWLLELNRFEGIADLGEPRFDADIISFQVWRTLSQRAAATASLQAMDGHVEEAIATILPYLEASRKLEATSRTLVRTMVARSVQRQALETLAFILDRHALAPATRARVATALVGSDSAAGARRIVSMEYPYFVRTVHEMTRVPLLTLALKSDATLGYLDAIRPFIFNPTTTVNRYSQRVHELAALAGARDLERFVARSSALDEEVRRGGIKNVGGRVFLTIATPELRKILQVYWEIEDLRTGLQTRLVQAG